MTVVITPVGTSLFNNGSENNSDIRNYFAEIKDHRESEWDSHLPYINSLRTACQDFITCLKVRASAELESSDKIQAELNNNITVHLIATDTIASRLAAEILKENSEVLGDEVIVEFDGTVDVIKGLQVENAQEFSDTGIHSLLNRLIEIRGNPEDKQSLAINITGGYGATLPILTVFGRINRVPLYYYFEDATELIEIQNILASARLAV